MKTYRWLAALGGLFLAGAGWAAAEPAAPRAEVIFDHPEKFTDVKDAFEPTERGEAAILGSFRDYLVKEARLFVPEGDRLTIVFTDIDLAGDFEPWRGAQFDEIRIIKAVYPPHFKFHYTLADASGRVLRAGDEDILDTTFQLRVTPNPEDPLRFEKGILQDWMRRRLAPPWPAPSAR